MAKRPSRSEQTLTDKAYVILEEQIITQDLAPGELLSEKTLSEELGIGRTPVREALQRLAQDGLVNIMPRRGIMVSEINVGAQLRMLEVRRNIERVLARSAAQRANAQEVEEFRSLAKQFRRAAGEKDDLLFMRVDKEFNELVIQAARNEFAEKAIRLMSGLSRRFFYSNYKDLVDLNQTAVLHAEIAEQISEKNTDKAEQASDALMDHIVELTRNAMNY